MEYLVGIIVALVAGLLYYKGKSEKSAADASLAETRGKDSELEKQQGKVEEEISEIDRAIADIREERKKRRDSKTKEERASEWEN